MLDASSAIAAVPSSATASRRPSGENASVWTTVREPAQLARGPQRARIPERHLSALARDREQAPVGAVGDRGDEAAQRPQAAPPAQRLGVEEVDRPVAVSECQRAAVRAERESARERVTVVGDERPRDGRTAARGCGRR